MKASISAVEVTRRAVYPADAVLVIDCQRSLSETDLPFALEKFLGRSALQRNIRQLAQQGTKHCVIAVKNAQELGVVGKIAEEQLSEIDARKMSCHLVAFDTLKYMDEAAWGLDVVFVNGNSVFDDRLFDAVFRSTAPSTTVAGPEGKAVGLVKLPNDDLCRILQSDHQDLTMRNGDLRGLRAIDTDSVPHYVASMRRIFPPYWHELENSEDLKAAADKVMDAAQKGVLDFPARYLHPLPENFLTRLAAGTSITPNQITVFSAVLAFIGTYLFATESYFAALSLALIAGILDGVDGKLARVKLLSSPFGDRLDHTLDVTFEFSWYIAIAWGLSQTHSDPSLFGLGFFMIGIMLTARALSGSYLYLTGHQIHDHTAFDRMVRLFAGRRNIYVLVLLVGYLMGNLLSSFYVVVAWGLATASIYLMRNAVAIMQKYARA